MSHLNIIRAWKDEEYRASLTDAERAQLPEHPAGLIELMDASLDEAAGGTVGARVSYVVVCLPQYQQLPVQSINVLACYGNLGQTIGFGPGPVA